MKALFFLRIRLRNLLENASGNWPVAFFLSLAALGVFLLLEYYRHS